MDFVNLYLESEYTLTSSPIKIIDLVDIANEYGYNTLAITDLNNMYGALKFYNKCIEKKIKPIIGLQLELIGFSNEKTKILAYAKNNDGYKNLLKLATLVKTSKPLNISNIELYIDNVLFVLPCEENEVVDHYFKGFDAQILLNQYKNFFSELYVGINTQSEICCIYFDKIINYFDKLNVKCVALNKVSFLRRDDYDTYKILNSIQRNATKYNGSEKEANSYLLNKDEQIQIFKLHPNLIANTIEIKEKCNVVLDFNGYHMPIYDKNIDTKLYLKELAITGLKRRLEIDKVSKIEYKKYADRIFYELDVICKMGFADYFLIVYDFIKYAKMNNILVGPGRGSAPSSLTAYSLGITEIDPIKYGLLFERFLNPERISMPDIDTDFSDYNRDEVIKYMGRKYGKNHVAHIGTFGTFGPRSAIRDVARVMGISNMYLDEVLLYIDNNVSSIESALENSILNKMYNENSTVKYLLDIAIKLQNLPRHVSIHAAGIIVCDIDLTNYTALQDGMNGLYQTQFESSDLEQLGLVKIDFLGLKNLTIIDDVIKMIPDKSFDLCNIPLNDKGVYEMLANKDTDGVFQLESSGMRNLLSQLKTSSFEDIYNALALYRPGPMDIIPMFIKRKFKNEPVIYIHKDLEEILKPTYGTIVFQEQIILIAQKFSGYTLGQADILRRAVSKKKTELMNSEYEKFINGAIKKGYQKEQAEAIFNYILKFANYGFNKSHSVAYSLVSYRMAYLKRYYPKEFMAVLMSNNIGKNRLIKSYILSCNKYGVKVFCPNINVSEEKFITNEEGIYFSLLAINGLGEVTISAFLNERAKNGLYKSYDEFILRTKDIFNRKNVEMLIYSGALDSFGLSRKSMINEYDKSIEISDFGSIFKDNLSEHSFDKEEYDFTTISKYEKEALGINLKYNIFKQLINIKTKYKTTEIDKFEVGKVYRFLFILDNYRVIKTKKGDEMAFLTVSDDTETIEGVLFPRVYREIFNELIDGKLYLGEVKTENREGKIQCIFNKMILIKKS